MRQTCPTCDGSGGVYPPGTDPFDRSAKKVTDGRCDGLGEIDVASDTDAIAEERVDLTEDERKVFDALTDVPQTAETISRNLGMSVFTVRDILEVGQQAGIAAPIVSSAAPTAYRRRPQSPFWTEVRS